MQPHLAGTGLGDLPGVCIVIGIGMFRLDGDVAYGAGLCRGVECIIRGHTIRDGIPIQFRRFGILIGADKALILENVAVSRFRDARYSPRSHRIRKILAISVATDPAV